MKLTITNNQASPVTILHLDGTLDGSNYESLFNEAQKLYAAGTRDLILDLSKLIFMSSAGMVALHQIALLFRGEKRPDQDEGWSAYRAIDRDRDRGIQKHIKLFGPTKQVKRTLDLVGFSAFFEIHSDIHQAAVSFRQSAPAMAAPLP